MPKISKRLAPQRVIDRLSEMDGNNAEALTFAANRLSSRYPLAALLLHRQIVEACPSSKILGQFRLGYIASVQTMP